MKSHSVINKSLRVKGALLIGPVVKQGDITTGVNLKVLPINRERFLELARRFRLRGHQDGWFVDGKGHTSQIWEYGEAKLGLTVDGAYQVHKAQKESSWLHPKAIGDTEANFWCDWTEENLLRLDGLVALQRRKVKLSLPDSPRT